MHKDNFREYTWREYPFEDTSSAEDLDRARRRIIEKFLIGKHVRIIVPKGMVITDLEVRFFIEMANKASRLKASFHLKTYDSLAGTLEQVPGAMAITLERL
jgi:hypothetical protein